MAELFARDTIKNLRKLRHLKPDLFKGFMDFDQMVFKDGALPAKTKELMAVTAAHVTQCMWCIEDHVKRAKALGAADEEIAEAPSLRWRYARVALLHTLASGWRCLRSIRARASRRRRSGPEFELDADDLTPGPFPKGKGSGEMD